MHTIEKIGGTSMSDYCSVRDNIILNNDNGPYGRVFVVSAYGGVTDQLLENKKTGEPGIYALFAGGMSGDNWLQRFEKLSQELQGINLQLFGEGELLHEANSFLQARLEDAKKCLLDLQSLCQHGHFSLDSHLHTVREMLASIGEAHSAWNTSRLLQRDGVNACFVDLTGWRANNHISLDERINLAFKEIDVNKQLPIVTGYAHSEDGLMSSFNRGYSEMTFSRLAVLTDACEAVIHKEFHLSSADPRLVGEANAVPIGRTNYDVADQLANLGMEAIHPKAAKGLRQNNIPLRVKNTFEPEHTGTLITSEYVSDSPCVEIIAGCKGVYALEVFDQDMAGNVQRYDIAILEIIQRFNAQIVSKDINANTITHYLSTNLKTVERIIAAIKKAFSEADINQQTVAIVSVIGSDMQIPGILAKSVQAVASANINVLSIHQAMRQVDMQFIVNESDYDAAVKSLHASLVEIHDHGLAICIAS
ncbi:aspartate kinase [Dasania sp. GY-MA-18]|uniref:aspartate kinase n=1 Tax=Dasania phycosphaerae TaxID=2950436 RepID=A0A9J6RGZ3_9GAMM|nr:MULTISPECIES: aspartate kinase [Dasania]MCR8921287.1 aspartate kinase [Dasania sp. GY-MA-18]MCZ0863715.1 aspartate kinase [Dasania phycosphaerae]MCZ0867443.1 aspartate kinase [Dasania phycosphaerae]